MISRTSIAILLVAVAEANYRSGEVRSTEEFLYGRFSTRMQGSAKMGTVTSFFTYWTGDNGKWSKSNWNELDVELVPSITSNPMSMNIIWRDQAQDQGYCAGFQPGTEWNDYVIEWAPGYVQWFINGNMVRRIEGTEDVAFMTKHQKLMMNFWTPTFAGWGDNFSDAGMPWFARYDYVKVESYNAATGGFEPLWEDNFDSFDAKRWTKSDGWGFESNSCTWAADSVYTENGALVLKMDYPRANALYSS